MSTDWKPYVGQTVQYFAYGTPGGEFPAGVARAAIITEVYEGHPDNACSVCVLNPQGFFFNHHVRQGNDPGCWNHIYLTVAGESSEASE